MGNTVFILLVLLTVFAEPSSARRFRYYSPRYYPPTFRYSPSVPKRNSTPKQTYRNPSSSHEAIPREMGPTDPGRSRPRVVVSQEEEKPSRFFGAIELDGKDRFFVHDPKRGRIQAFASPEEGRLVDRNGKVIPVTLEDYQSFQRGIQGTYLKSFSPRDTHMLRARGIAPMVSDFIKKLQQRGKDCPVEDFYLADRTGDAGQGTPLVATLERWTQDQYACITQGITESLENESKHGFERYLRGQITSSEYSDLVKELRAQLRDEVRKYTEKHGEELTKLALKKSWTLDQIERHLTRLNLLAVKAQSAPDSLVASQDTSVSSF